MPQNFFLANDDSRQIANLALTKQFLRVVFTIIKYNIEIDVRFCFLFSILRIAIGTQSWFHYPLLSECCFESHWISCFQVNVAEHSWCMKALVVGKLYRHAKLISIIPQNLSYTCWKEIVTGYFLYRWLSVRSVWSADKVCLCPNSTTGIVLYFPLTFTAKVIGRHLLGMVSSMI